MILLDTHVVAWLAFDPAQISKKAHLRIAAERLNSGGLAISGATLWELASMTLKRRLLVQDLAEFLDHVESTFTVFPITATIAGRAAAFSKRYPRDPMDRIIGATALVHNLQLVTRDIQITASGEVPCLW